MNNKVHDEAHRPHILSIDGNKYTEKLSYKDKSLVAIKAEYTFDIINSDNTLSLLKEFNRVLHIYGAAYIKTKLKGKKLQSLKKLIKASGFAYIEEQSEDELYISHNKIPHQIDSPLTDEQFRNKCAEFNKQHANPIPTSYVITVYNEEKNLPHLFSFLENIKNETKAQREFIFVLNGCNDRSEEILLKYTKRSLLNTKVIHSKPAILNAFKAGIEARTLDGFIGKFDADIILHPHVLDLMQIYLHENKDVQVTYAEPITFQTPSDFNETVYKPEIMSKRLYYTGKTSLCRNDPRLIYNKMSKDLIAEDIFNSFYFIYNYGFDSIARTPNALVYENIIDNFDDLVSQLSRSSSEITRIFKSFPEFEPLGKIVEQSVNPESKYGKLYFEAEKKIKYVDSWIRLESTK